MLYIACYIFAASQSKQGLLAAVLSDSPAIVVNSENENAVNVFYEDVQPCWLWAAPRIIILYKYLIVLMLCAYFVDNEPAAEAGEP